MTVLSVLLQSEDLPVTTEVLTSKLWPSTPPDESGQRIRELIAELRGVLGDTARSPKLIETVRGVGYRFVGSIVVQPTAKEPAVTSAAEAVPRSRAGPALWWLALFVSVAAGAALLTVAPRPRPDSRRIESKMVWRGPNQVADMSHDGKSLCYPHREDNSLQIHALETNRPQAITAVAPKSKVGGAMGCVLSEDAAWVAYVKEMGTYFELRVANLSSRQDRVILTVDRGDLSAKDWFGGRDPVLLAAVCHDAGDGKLMRVRVDGTLLDSYPVASCPEAAQVSPDGRWIAYLTLNAQDGRRSIGLMKVADGAQFSVVSAGDIEALAGWTPDGREIAYTSSESGGAVFAVKVSLVSPVHIETPARRLLANLGGIRPLGISRTGELSYALGSLGRTTYIAALDWEAGRLVEPPTRAAPQLPLSLHSADWSPEGRLAALPSLREAVLTSVLLGKDARLTHLRAGFRPEELHWAKEPTRLLGSGRYQAGSGIASIDIDSGTTRFIRKSTLLSASYADAVECPRTGKMYYKLRDYHKEPSRLFSALSGQPAALDKMLLPSVYSFALSRDGEVIVYSSFDDTHEFVRLLYLKSGQSRELHREPREGRIVSVAITPDRRYVLYARRGQLWKISLDGSGPSKLPLTATALRDLRPHPDGRRLAFSAGEANETEVWVTSGLLAANGANSQTGR